MGCYRSVTEIRAWFDLDDKTKTEILNQIEKRKPWTRKIKDWIISHDQKYPEATNKLRKKPFNQGPNGNGPKYWPRWLKAKEKDKVDRLHDERLD